MCHYCLACAFASRKPLMYSCVLPFRSIPAPHVQVKKYVVLASQDIRFDVPLAEACYEDRQKFCANVPPVSASKRG